MTREAIAGCLVGLTRFRCWSIMFGGLTRVTAEPLDDEETL